MAVKKGTKLHTKASIKKMLATRKRNLALKAKETVDINLPGVTAVKQTEIPYLRISKPEENLEVLYAKHSQHFSPAEQREIEEAIRLLKLFSFVIEITKKEYPF